MKNPIDRTEVLKLYDDNPEALLRDAHDAEHIDVAADYVSRGRSFGTLGIAELEEKSTEATAAFVADMTNPDKFRELEAVSAELRLRGLEPPLPSIEQLKIIFDHAERVANELLENYHDPQVQELLIEESAVGKLLKSLIERRSKN